MAEKDSNRGFTTGESHDRVNEMQPGDHGILVLISLVYLVAQLNEELQPFEVEALDDVFLAYHPDQIRNLQHLFNEILHFSSKIHVVDLLIIDWIAMIYIGRNYIPQHVRLRITTYPFEWMVVFVFTALAIVGQVGFTLRLAQRLDNHKRTIWEYTKQLTITHEDENPILPEKTLSSLKDWMKFICYEDWKSIHVITTSSLKVLHRTFSSDGFELGSHVPQSNLIPLC